VRFARRISIPTRPTSGGPKSSKATSSSETDRHRVVVVGGGFGGLRAVQRLRREPVDVTLIDRRNFHLFQPLLYQVATGALSASEIASPLRGVFARNRNVSVVLGEVTGFDLAGRRVLVGALPSGEQEVAIPYDSLVVAGGSRYTYFGHDEWRPFAPDVKTLESALDVRRRILGAFEAAEVETDAAKRAAWLTFVVVGGGPTGVELAGQIGEIARSTLRRDFRSIDPGAARILLVETADRVLPQFPPRLSASAARSLDRLGVMPLTGRTVVGIDAESVTIGGGAENEIVPARTVVWAAGVVASELAAALAREAGTELDRAGRLAVGPDLTVAGHPGVIALGDMVQVHDVAGRPVDLPGLAPVAMQQGRYAARAIGARLRGNAPAPFRYRDKGNLATIGRARAVADIKGLQLSGLLAWVTWLFVHLFYLIGFQNRLLVFIRWTFSFVTHGRGARLITGEPPGPSVPRS
jgi:NADH:ubiquinone reductase (H+-translocating)